jgi:superfamily II DNA or RNA helicase
MLSKVLVYDTARNGMIAEDIIRQVQEGRKILVLTERKEHVEILSLYLKGKAEIITITGDDSAAKKKSKMEQIKMGHFQVLISTGQFFGEGMDIENLDCLFLVYPFSFEGKLIQYIGRIQRSKGRQTIFDYRDKNIDYCEKLFKKRNRYYRKMIQT